MQKSFRYTRSIRSSFSIMQGLGTAIRASSDHETKEEKEDHDNWAAFLRSSVEALKSSSQSHPNQEGSADDEVSISAESSPAQTSTGTTKAVSLNPNAAVFPNPLHVKKQSENWYYVVEFKRNRRERFVGLPGYGIDAFVMVEADRGADIGRIVSVSRTAPPHQLSDATTRRAKILQSASEENVWRLQQKTLDEARALAYCREKVLSYGLPLLMIDAEYQFDRKKLTFYFAARTRIDFRRLVRDLFAVYHTRVWMQQVETTVELRQFLRRFHL